MYYTPDDDVSEMQKNLLARGPVPQPKPATLTQTDLSLSFIENVFLEYFYS